MSFFLDASYYEVNKRNGLSPFQNLCAYLGGSAIQTVGDNPVTAYRQLVQQFAKNAQGVAVSPKEAMAEANAVFRTSPISASLSGLWPRMIGEYSRSPRSSCATAHEHARSKRVLNVLFKRALHRSRLWTDAAQACPFFHVN
jgi:hypothetical protein